jgi:hypothetical protein
MPAEDRGKRTDLCLERDKRRATDRRSLRVDIACQPQQAGTRSLSLSATRSAARAADKPRSASGLRSGCILTPLVPLAIRLGSQHQRCGPPRASRVARARTSADPGGRRAATSECRPPARPPKGLGRKEHSSHGAGWTTTVRRRGLALFEREPAAPAASASSRGAGEGRRTVDRRDETLFEGEPFWRGSRTGGTAARPGDQRVLTTVVNPPLNKYEARTPRHAVSAACCRSCVRCRFCACCRFCADPASCRSPLTMLASVGDGEGPASAR